MLTLRIQTGMLALLLASASAHGEDGEAGERSTAQPPIIVQLSAEAGGWRLGSEALPAQGWFALGCDDQDCALYQVSVQISSLSRSQGDDQYVYGRVVRLASELPAGQRLLALLHTDQPPWLHEGPLTTYHPRPGPLPKDGHDRDFDLRLPGLAGEEVLMPVRLDFDGYTETIGLRLRRGEQVQWLGVVQLCAYQLHDRYLSWAGDLDRDGAGDYLIDLSGAGSQPRLLLSSYAGPGEMVGLAGGAASAPSAEHCW